jgi:3-phosphoshikimate 1-carboxyvinyltransferase
MPLPDLIEIVPLDKPVHAEITVPGSKSITNRALILAALADGETTLEGALWSEDTQVMVDALRKLGFAVEVLPGELEFCNRIIKVKGQGGKIPNAGTDKDPLQIFVGNAGTAARFLAPMVCLGHGVYRLQGVSRMHERPQAALLQALRELGYRGDSLNDRLPVAIHGTGPRKGKCRVSIEESSQFASGLIMSAGVGGWEVEVTGENAEESPYVAMTSNLIQAFPKTGGTFYIEPDASGGSYFLGATNYDVVDRQESHSADGLSHSLSARLEPTVKVCHWPESGWQIDARFQAYVRLLDNYDLETSENRADVDRKLELLWGQEWREKAKQQYQEYIEQYYSEHEPLTISRKTDLGDSIMTLIALAPTGTPRFRFTDLGRLRLQECERVVALRTELTKCGAKVIETGDVLEVHPSKLHGAEIETYGDHRMAMCFAVLGLKVPGIKIRNPSCVKKTFPDFFQKLATPPPHGLGATILDGTTGRKLALAELFAE